MMLVTTGMLLCDGRGKFCQKKAVMGLIEWFNHLDILLEDAAASETDQQDVILCR